MIDKQTLNLSIKSVTIGRKMGARAFGEILVKFMEDEEILEGLDTSGDYVLLTLKVLDKFLDDITEEETKEMIIKGIDSMKKSMENKE